MQTLVAEILEAWRRAERLAAELDPATPDHAAAVLACERLRELYHDLTRAGAAAVLTDDERRALRDRLAAD